MICLSGISGRFSSKFLKCSFHLSNLSSWMVALNFTLEMLFIPLISFTVYHANRDCLFSTEFLILSIWPWMYSNCSTWSVLVLWGGGFFKFQHVAISWVSFIEQRCFFKVFFLNYLWLPWKSTFGSMFDFYALCSFFPVDDNKVFIFVIKRMSFRCLLKSIKFNSYSFYKYINYIVRTSHNERFWLFVSYFFVDSGFAESILRSENTPSEKKCVSQFKALFIHFLFMSI